MNVARSEFGRGRATKSLRFEDIDKDESGYIDWPEFKEPFLEANGLLGTSATWDFESRVRESSYPERSPLEAKGFDRICTRIQPGGSQEATP